MAFNMVNNVTELEMNKQVFGTDDDCGLSAYPFYFLNSIPLKFQKGG